MAFPHLSVCFPTNRWRPGCPVHPPLQGSHPQPRCFFPWSKRWACCPPATSNRCIYIYINGLVKGKIYQNLILGCSCRFFLKPIQMNIIRAILNHLLNLLHPERQPKIATLAFRVWPPAFPNKNQKQLVLVGERIWSPKRTYSYCTSTKLWSIVYGGSQCGKCGK